MTMNASKVTWSELRKDIGHFVQRRAIVLMAVAVGVYLCRSDNKQPPKQEQSTKWSERLSNLPTNQSSKIQR